MTDTLTTARSGIPPACAKRIAAANEAVVHLFMGKDKQTPCAGLQRDQSFSLRCVNDAIAWHWSQQMWQDAQAGDQKATYASAKGWWKRIKELVDAAEASEPTEEPAPCVESF